MQKKTGWYVFLMVFAASCLDEPDCINLTNDVVGVAFKKLSDRTVADFSVDNITAYGTDYAFNKPDANGVVYLPLNSLVDTTTFLFTIGPDSTYALHLKYSSKAQFVSEECGSQFVFEDLEIIKDTFEDAVDSVRLVSNIPGTGARQSPINIEILKR